MWKRLPGRKPSTKRRPGNTSSLKVSGSANSLPQEQTRSALRSLFVLPRAYLRSRELESCKAKRGEEAECTFVHEHSEPVFNAAGPTRSRSYAGSQRC